MLRCFTGNIEAMKTFALAAFMLLFYASARAQEFPSNWRFVTVRSAHFDVIVNAEQQDLGRFYANKLEAAYRDLRPLWTDMPTRLTVVVADNTDITNGYATKLPYSHVFIYPVLPGPQDSLSESGDWVYELVAHEYTHSLTFESVSGVMEPLQSVFGSILSPNLLLPRWWKEGIAVHIETALSNGGRLRSGYQDAVLRALTLDGGLDRFDLAQINEILPDWPRGLRPYMFGSLFWSEAVAQKGTIIIDQLHQRHGGRVPYFVEAPARDLLGVSYETFYRGALAETERRAREQLRALAAIEPVEGRPIHIDGIFSQNPRISPDGTRLALISVNRIDKRSLKILERNPQTGDFEEPRDSEAAELDHEEGPTSNIEDAPPAGSIGRVEWFPDGRRMIYDKPENLLKNRSTSDLWIFDLDKKKSEKLTTGLRAREPFVSRDGQSVLFVGLDAAKTWLGRYHLADGRVERLWSGGWQERVSFPTELPDGRVVFALRNERAEEYLHIWSPGGEPPRRILEEFPDAKFPSWSEDGLVFTAKRNGVYNAYQSSPDLETAVPVSHTRTAVFSSVQDDRTGDYYLTALGPMGFRVVRVPANGIFRGEDLPAVEALFADRYPRRPPPDTPEVPVEIEPYRAGSYLWPQYWLPLFGVSSVNGSVLLEASTSGFDPLKYHVYALGASWDAGLAKGSFAASYQNNQTGWPITIQAAQSHSYFVSPENPVTNDSAAISVQPDIFSLSQDMALGLSWRWLQTEVGGTRARRTGPAWSLQYLDYARTGFQISPEDGKQAYVATAHFLEGQDQYEYNQYMLGGGVYFSKWLPARHALMARTSVVHTPEPLAAALGTSTTNFFFVPDAPGASYVMRGYRVGHFFGKSLASANVEYRFPGQEIRRGSGTDPVYLLRWHGAVFVDGAAVDGFAFRPASNAFARVPSSQTFLSTGVEARLETTVGYVVPLNFVVGYAAPLSEEYSDGGGLIMSLQLGSLF